MTELDVFALRNIVAKMFGGRQTGINATRISMSNVEPSEKSLTHVQRKREKKESIPNDGLDPQQNYMLELAYYAAELL